MPGKHLYEKEPEKQKVYDAVDDDWILMSGFLRINCNLLNNISFITRVLK